jgi:isopenicillin-N epimerase
VNIYAPFKSNRYEQVENTAQIRNPMQAPERSEYSGHWSLDESCVFLNHGSFGATPTVIQEEQRRWQTIMENEPVRFFEKIAPSALETAREAIADFVNCDADDLALIENATTGVNTILRSLEFSPGDEILVPDHAYQACRNTIDYVAKRWKAVVVICKIPFPIENQQQAIDAIMSKVSEKTVLAMIDTVTSPTGLLMPFETLVRELESRGINVLLDGAHGIGMINLDLDKLGASYTTSNCHKWLCSPKSSAFLHVRKDLQHKIHPLTISHGMTFPLGDTTRFRHEFDWTGTRDLSAHCSLPLVIDEMAKLVEGGWPSIIAKNHELAIKGRNILCERLGIKAPSPDEMISCIATLQLPETSTGGTPMHEPDPLHELLLEKYGIQVPVWSWDSPKGRYIRISAQLYNDVGEYHYLADAIAIELGL